MNNTIAALAMRVAKRYARRVWWASIDDMAQDAALAMLEALPRYDTERGALEPYLQRVGVLAVRNALWKASAPVSTPTNPDRKDTERLRGLHRISDAVLEWGGDTELPDDGSGPRRIAPAPLEQAYSLPVAEEELIQHCVRSVLRTAIDMATKGSHDLRLAEPVLADELTPAEVAAELSLPVERVYKAVQRARLAIATDKYVRKVWRSPWLRT